MAIYGTLGEVDLGALDASISDTAVDIFVYDTRKDSDGGAWRKRTQHTSWYNETLNTATRGSRREFPAVAVIVSETGQVTIYDGDDPDLPMWMVFNGTAGGASHNLLVSTGDFCLSALNGTVFMGSLAIYVNFISEYSRGHRSTGNAFYWNGPYKGNIAERNAGKGSTQLSDKLILGGSSKVAMTVLPNAPIDDVTGLPIPTIAVATGGGTSIIKDDGTVSDLKRGSGSYTNSVQFTDNNSIMLVWGHANDAIRHINHYSYADWQTDQNDYDQTTGYYELPQFGSSALQSPLKSTASGIVDGVLVNLNGQNRMSAKWDDYGLKLADLNDSDPANGMVAHIRPEYNSGWMHGDCKGAFLADTDDTNVTGSDLITNGTFDSDVSGWSASTSGNGTTISHHTDGGGNTSLRVVSDTSTYGSAVTQVALESNTTYVLSYYLRSTGGTTAYYARTGYGTDPNAQYYNNIHSDNSATVAAQNTFTFTTGTITGTQYLKLASRNDGTDFRYDNISLRKAELDRSVNDNGLQVFGTITKSAVATGADLVGYSGYSSSNYLVQPSIAAPGTGDFSVSGWIKPGSANGTGGNYLHLFSLGTSSTGGQSSSTGFVLKFATYSGANSNGFVPYFYNNDGGTNHGTYDANNYLPLGVWGHIVATRKNGVTYIYLNGELVKIGSAWTTNLTDTYATVFLGLSQTNETGGEADVSLLRYSLSAPSTTQVKKMYEDEKVLFQENVACTLYGSSDAVTALAYDDSTNLLYAGTSSGRSDFQGLRRINNTTTAVTTAISASNGLVAEQ